jgi:hypothetical protein
LAVAAPWPEHLVTGGGIVVTVSLTAARSRWLSSPGGRRSQGRGWLPKGDSVWWLALVAAAFTASQLVFVSQRLGLSWDETVYVSQLSAHAPAAYFDPARARGIPLLVAPVTLLTSSVLALRVYLSAASGLGLFLALLAWRRLRPVRVLALAGLVFGGLWTAEYYGPQAMPDLWVALSGLAAVGLFLQASARLGAGGTSAGAGGTYAPGRPGTQEDAGHAARLPAARAWGALAGLAACMAFAALVRPGDAVFLAAPLAAAPLAVRSWRRWQLPAATLAGLAAGGAEWVIEAYVRFGGPLARLHDAGGEQGGFGLHPAVWDELRAINGPTLCRPCTVGWRQPELGLWWLALPVLVTLGVFAARRAGRLGAALLPAACGLCVAAQYLLLINYAAPRFLLPAYALLALPVADGLAGLVSGVRAQFRAPAAVAVGCCLALQLLAQHLVLDHEVRGTITFHDDYARIVADLRRLGIRSPCLIKGEQFIPIAFYAGCASAPSPAGIPHPDQVAVLENPGVRPPRYARHWQLHKLPGTRVLKLVAYLPEHDGIARG